MRFYDIWSNVAICKYPESRYYHRLRWVFIIFALTFIVLCLGCGKEKKMLNSAENLFQQGNYKQVNELCQQIIIGKPKPEVLSRAKTLLSESAAGIDYSAAKALMENDKKKGLSELVGIKNKHSSTSFASKIDSCIAATKSFLLSTDLDFALQSANSLADENNFEEAIAILQKTSANSLPGWKVKAQATLATVQTLKVAYDKRMQEMHQKEEQEQAQKNGGGIYAGLKFGMSQLQVLKAFASKGIKGSPSDDGKGIKTWVFEGTLLPMRGIPNTITHFCDDHLYQFLFIGEDGLSWDQNEEIAHRIKGILKETYGVPTELDGSSIHTKCQWGSENSFLIALDIPSPKVDEPTVRLEYFNRSYLSDCQNRKEDDAKNF